MNQRIRVASALLLAMLSVAGCGNRPAGYSRAFGKLTYKGQPAAGAFLVFQLEGGKPQSADTVVPAATVEDDGSFELASAEWRRGPSRQIQGPGCLAGRLARGRGRDQFQSQGQE